MHCVNIFEAKTSLSKLIESLETGKEDEILIARHGRPVARLSQLAPSPVEVRIGIAKGKFSVPDSIDTDNDTVAKLFLGE